MVSRLVLILGDQLSEEIAALREADRDKDIVVMAEVMDEASYVRHHLMKVCITFLIHCHHVINLWVTVCTF